jgi:hypothetical protein
MIIWEGRGFVVGVITFGCLLATEAAVEAAFADDGYYQKHHWPVAAGFGAAAILTGLADRLLRRPPERVLLDPETGEKVVLAQRDTFFFIPVRYWPPLLLVVGLAFGLLKPPG